jgi:subtilisin family serine protease
MDIAAVRNQILARLAKRAHRVLHTYESIPMIALEVGPEGLQELEAAALQVERVFIDTLHAPSLAESVPLTGTDQAWSQGFDGMGTVVAILDTGVQASHPFLSGKVIEEACYSSTTSTSVSVCPNGQDEQIGPGAGVNCSIAGCWHGTHVAGIAAGDGAGAGVTFSGMAKGADIMAVQVFSRFNGARECGSPPCVLAWTSDIVAGLERVYALRGTRNIAAANLSLGGGAWTTACDDPTKPIIDNLRSAGIATVVASGNGGLTNAMSSPACVSTAISVGATTKSDAVASFSNVSPLMSLFAPGQSINSSYVGGGFASASGTSMATPHVTGAWAVLKQAAPTASVDRILSALQETGIAISDTRPGGTVTKRRINVASALTALGGTVSVTATPTTVVAGETVTATWGGIAEASPTDWIGLYASGTPDGWVMAWLYVGCSQTAGTARAAGACSFPIPSGIAAGTYELRLFANNGYTRLATSGPLTVTVGSMTLSETPASVTAGGSVTATWSGIASPTPMDWIGIYAPATAEASYLAWVYVSCSQVPGPGRAEGSCLVPIPGGLGPGTYELRLFANNSYTRLATSALFRVTAAPNVTLRESSTR